MTDTMKKIGEVSESDSRLIERVRKLREQARISEMLLNSHLGEEYSLGPGSFVNEAGEIWDRSEKLEITPKE